MYPYEGMFLLDPVKHGADPESTEKAVTDLLEKHGAKIVQSERWDERKLAYEIKGHKRGVYLLTYFEMPGENVDAMRRETRIIEPILRQMVVRLRWDIPTYLEKSKEYSDKLGATAEAPLEPAAAGPGMAEEERMD
jgi:small subunit ribosomal protein S6